MGCSLDNAGSSVLVPAPASRGRGGHIKKAPAKDFNVLSKDPCVIGFENGGPTEAGPLKAGGFCAPELF